ncbi:MAG: hypothetical protein IKI28_02030 [Bacteroidales bacterium]|nr:hypothetical protein [Bacteroidales bacterium]
MEQNIDTYRLTNPDEEPSDAILAQLMHEAAEEAARTNEEATAKFFEALRLEAQKIDSECKQEKL